MTLPPKLSLEERVAQLQVAQRRQQGRWAEQGLCEQCGSNEGVAEVVDGYSDIRNLLCEKCRNARSD